VDDSCWIVSSERRALTDESFCGRQRFHRQCGSLWESRSWQTHLLERRNHLIVDRLFVLGLLVDGVELVLQLLDVSILLVELLFELEDLRAELP